MLQVVHWAVCVLASVVRGRRCALLVEEGPSVSVVFTNQQVLRSVAFYVSDNQRVRAACSLRDKAQGRIDYNDNRRS